MHRLLPSERPQTHGDTEGIVSTSPSRLTRQLTCVTIVSAVLMLAAPARRASAQEQRDTTHLTPTAPPKKTVDRAFAWALGVAIPGAGHVYAGETTRGLLFGSAAIVGGVIAFRGAEGGTSEAGALVWLTAWSVSLFDLPRALRHHEDRPVVALGAAHRSVIVAISLSSP